MKGRGDMREYNAWAGGVSWLWPSNGRRSENTRPQNSKLQNQTQCS
jgi:hypothetical protein